ncbi:tautomerase family protein [Brevibacillus migulae]|uniref:tautomerase family protein n=1 Tax=Brevibacillus migulae TaxID=1644114 RepID=UPI00106E111E|nr:tautomerase family protein [Brevibacillus migulae]
MAQVKIFGVNDRLQPIKRELSDTIHACIVEALQYPVDKRFHRFFPMEREDFFFPDDRTEAYTIIEISLFEGRSKETKKQLIRLLFERIHRQLQLSPQDIEITIFETPTSNWGIRGVPGDELQLTYQVNV